MITVTPDLFGSTMEVFAAAVKNLTGMAPACHYRVTADFFKNPDGTLTFLQDVVLTTPQGTAPPDFQAYVDGRPVVTKPVYDHLGKLVGQQLVEPISLRDAQPDPAAQGERESLRERLARVLACAGPMESRRETLDHLMAEIERGAT